MSEEKLMPFKYMLAFFIIDTVWSLSCLIAWGYATFILGASPWWTILLLACLGAMNKKRFVSFVRMRMEEL